MKIRKMRATFGKLQNDTLSFHDGLNVIFAPNESGKSTWCAFISAMLYGIDSFFEAVIVRSDIHTDTAETLLVIH